MTTDNYSMFIFVVVLVGSGISAFVKYLRKRRDAKKAPGLPPNR